MVRHAIAARAAIVSQRSIPLDQQFPWSEPLPFWHFWEPRDCPHPIIFIEGGAHSERRGSSWQELSSLAKQQTGKGKLYEKASLNCIDGKWIGFRSRAAFRRSNFSWNWGSWNRIWLSGLPIWLLRLSGLRIRVLSVWILPIISELWLLHGALVLRASRLPPPPSSLLPFSVLSWRRI